MRKQIMWIVMIAGVLVLSSGCGKTGTTTSDQGTSVNSEVTADNSTSQSSTNNQVTLEPDSGEETSETKSGTETDGIDNQGADSSESSVSKNSQSESDTSKSDSTKETKEEEADSSKTDDTLEEIVAFASEIGEGVAGTSLKRAQLAAEVASLAAKKGYTADDVKTLTAELQKKVNGLDEDGKESFHTSFLNGVIPLLDAAIVDDDLGSVKSDFEDAGELENIKKLLKVSGIAESYDAIKSAYLAIE